MKIFMIVETGKGYFENLESYCRLVAIFPQADRGHGIFRVELPQDDPKIGQIIACLESIGHKPKPHGATRPREIGEYSLTYLRKYDEGDFKKAALMVPVPHARAEMFDRSLGHELRDGLLHIETRDHSKKWAFAEACWWWVVARTHVKTAVEASNLKGVEFRPVKINFRTGERGTDQLWELTSSFHLPKLAPSCTLFHSDMTPFTGDYSRGCRLEEGLFVPAEFHYRQSDLKDQEPFDLARTHEEFPIFRPNDPRQYFKLVASRRFYEFCKANKFQIDWIPVRIDPD